MNSDVHEVAHDFHIAEQGLGQGVASAAFSTEFESAGINQSRHKIFLSLHAQARLVIPGDAKQVDLKGQVLIAESIIVGEVPQSYVNVPEMDDALNFALP